MWRTRRPARRAAAAIRSTRLARAPGRAPKKAASIWYERMARSVARRGYAKAPEEIRSQWEGLLGPYLQGRDALAGLVLVSARGLPLKKQPRGYGYQLSFTVEKFGLTFPGEAVTRLFVLTPQGEEEIRQRIAAFTSRKSASKELR